ncbi:hypothetical protein MCOR07_004014 [Pyricularia oryzae]|nr:hypothetical protein MCOR01_006989 [Pyricularia oryzae]KAI6260738.1 hypothetical protein MCOR19_002955 [Pyricularia oryzae]KAI6322792.1 hypothetical protein MCOR30_007544 [Pyricularia oryzae]KAI6328524.1 hypothetical protein MCOR29_002662 [Pyricularia oryzae]KAI6411370.1 hypothetical protein MCOR23_000231 [Pyricularia oryzae]
MYKLVLRGLALRLNRLHIGIAARCHLDRDTAVPVFVFLERSPCNYSNRNVNYFSDEGGDHKLK